MNAKLAYNLFTQGQMPQLLKEVMPRPLRSGSLVRAVAMLFRHVLLDYGWLKSLRLRRCVDGNGRPIPWFTYPAIDYLNQVDLSDMEIFEWGSGHSTAYWSERAKSVISIETDQVWAQDVRRLTGNNCNIILSSRDMEEYVGHIFRFSVFDIIVIDGIGEARRACAMAAASKIRPGGFIILDNSDLSPESAEILRGHNYIEIDFVGFSPLDVHSHTTSLFLSRDFNPKPRGAIQPTRSVAQPSDIWPGQ